MKLWEFALLAALLVPAGMGRTQCVAGKAPVGQPYTLQAGTRAVFVDVVVSDRNRQGRVDLKQDSFHITEDGRAQTPRSFTLHSGDMPVSRETAGATQRLSPGDFSNFHSAQAGQPINILLLDTLNTSMADQQRSRQQVISVLTSLPPGQPVALFTLGTRLRMIQDFTQKPDTLIAAASQIKSHPSPLYIEHGPDQVREDDSVSGADVMKQQKMRMLSGSPEAARIASEAIDEAFAERGADRLDVRVQITIASLKQLAQALAGYPGRKRLIWLSGSFPLSLGRDAGLGASPNAFRDYGPRLHELATELSTSQVAVYAVDVRGLVTVGADASTAGVDASVSRATGQPSSLYMDRQETGIHASQATLQELAHQTGGRAYINQNDIARAVRDALQDGSVYFSLSYTPTNGAFDGKYREIEVKVDGVRQSDLQFRRGYYAMPDSGSGSDQQHKEAFRSAMQLNAPESSAVSIEADIHRSGAGELLLDYTIDAHALSLAEGADCTKKVGMIVGVVSWRGSGEPDRKFTVVEQALAPGQVENVLANGLHARQVLASGSGPAIVKVGAMDLATGVFGTLNVTYNGSTGKP